MKNIRGGLIAILVTGTIVIIVGVRIWINYPRYSWKEYSGQDIAFVSEGSVYIVNSDGSNKVQLSQDNSPVHFLSWSPNGEFITFEADTGIHLLSLRKFGAEHLNYSGHRPVWSPDSSKIAFSSNRDGFMEIYFMNVDGSEQTKLTNLGLPDEQPYFFDWMLSGEKIIFAYSKKLEPCSKLEFFSINIDGTDPTSVFEIPSCIFSWTQDMSQIAFMERQNDESNIYIMNADGSDLRLLSQQNSFVILGPWSPDNQMILINLKEGAYVLKKDGTEISDMDFWWGGTFSWSPDSKNIVYVSDRLEDFKGYREITIVNIDASTSQFITDNGPYCCSDWKPSVSQ